MAVYPYVGMRGVHEFNDSARPQTWREKMLELNPNGNIPLTALTGMMGRGDQKLTDEQLNWKVRELSTQAGAVAGIYLESTLTTAYVYASHQSTYGIAGQTVYAKVALAVAKLFREGHQVILRDSDRYDVDVNAKVVGVYHNGASSWLACKLLEADDNSATAASYNLATVDRVFAIGNINSQGGTRPGVITYDPVDVYNLSGIWRTALSIPRTLEQTKLRGRDAYLDMKEQSLLYHGIEMEKSLLWSIRTQNTGANGQNENTIMGVFQFIKTYLSANVDNFKLNTTYSGKTWAEAGKTWLDNMLKNIASKGNGMIGGDVMCVCGAGAALGIQQMVENSTIYQITEKTRSYGIIVNHIQSLFLNFDLKIHPLFSYESTNDYTAVFIPIQKVKWWSMQDTIFKPDMLWDKGGAVGVDGKQEEWLTEGTYSYDADGPWGILDGVGEDNIV